MFYDFYKTFIAYNFVTTLILVFIYKYIAIDNDIYNDNIYNIIKKRNKI